MDYSDIFHQKFADMASRLSEQFPQLDLRFNLTEGDEYMRCMLPEVSDEVLEFHLGSDSDRLLHEAIFAIKEVARLFDA